MKILLTSLAGLLSAFLIKGLDNRLVKTTYVIRSAKISGKIKIAFLSDLHSCPYGSGQNKLLSLVREIEPDLIMLGGDIVDDKGKTLPAEESLEQLQQTAPCFYVSGNHEIYTGKLDLIKDLVRSYGVRVLAGEKVEIQIGANRINILGIDDPLVGQAYQSQLDHLAGLSNPEFTIFLAHHPERVEDYERVEADLVLSGHAHGGLWRIPHILPGIVATGQGLFPKYTAGIYQLSNKQLLVNRGLSLWSPKLPRFYNPPEVVELVLEESNTDKNFK